MTVEISKSIILDSKYSGLGITEKSQFELTNSERWSSIITTVTTDHKVENTDFQK